MAGDWRNDVSEVRPMLALGQFEGTISLEFEDEGEQVEKELEQEDGSTEDVTSVKFAVTYEQGASDYEDKNGDALESGEGYYLYTGSARLLSELKEAASSLAGETVEITAEGRNFDRTYSVEMA